MQTDKFKSLVHYICWSYSSDPSKLNAIRLNRLLWLADQEAYRRHGKPITDARYKKSKSGPVPVALLSTLRELEAEGTLDITETVTYGSRRMTLLARKRPQPAQLSPRQQHLVDEILQSVRKDRTDSFARYDHLWKSSPDGTEIFYSPTIPIPAQIPKSNRQSQKPQIAIQ